MPGANHSLVESASRTTAPPAPEASDLAGLGSHLNPPLPEIYIHDLEAQSHRRNKSSHQLNASLNIGSAGQDDSFVDTTGDGQSAEHGTSKRSRSDSLQPGSDNKKRGGTVAGFSLSTDGVQLPVGSDGFLSPVRRASFSPMETSIEVEEHDYGSDLDSAAVYPGDLSETSDTENDRMYTGLLMPGVTKPSKHRATSVISDGGEQDHLAMKESSRQQTLPPLPILSKPVRANTQRNALQRRIYSAMEEARSDDASLPTQRFLPKDKLCAVVNPNTVFDELMKCLPDTNTNEQIRAYAETICEVTPCYKSGRLRHKSYRMVFVILVLVERSKHILSFLEEDVSDLDLPLVPTKEFGSIFGMKRRHPSLGDPPGSSLDCFDYDEWSPSSMEQFDRYQWFMLAPFFSQGKNGRVNHYPLHDQHILPFVTWTQAEDDSSGSQGGYGKVTIVTLHPAHHKLGHKTSHSTKFAVKQLLLNDRKSFEREREILKKFSGVHSHQHIVSLRATYSYRGKYHFIFDRANSDLGRFWASHSNCSFSSYSDVVWIADQCSGIMEGLFKIHRHRTFKKGRNNKDGIRGAPVTRDRSDDTVRGQADDKSKKGKEVTFGDAAKPAQSETGHSSSVNAAIVPTRSLSTDTELPEQYEMKYGRHGDINPQNILWFGDEVAEPSMGSRNLRGILKIADFGTAEMNSKWSKSGQRDVANTMTYRPPECDSEDRRIGQSFDIWCLGCVFLEFVTWSLGGTQLLQSFTRKRMSRDPTCGNIKTDTFFELIIKDNGGRMEAKIKDSVFEFVKKLHNDERCTDFFHDLLHIIICHMLLVDSKERLSCRELCRKLKRLREACQSEEYALHPSQWRNGQHLAPAHLLRSSPINLSKEAHDQVISNLPKQ